MKKTLSLLFLITFFLMLSACSSSEEAARKETISEDSVYVFDEVPEEAEETKQTEGPPLISAPSTFEQYYLLQIGAFTTKDKAEAFAEKSRKKLNEDIIVIYSNQVNLFVVQLSTIFQLRESAERVRNKLWKTEDYKDAWILTVTK